MKHPKLVSFPRWNAAEPIALCGGAYLGREGREVGGRRKRRGCVHEPGGRVARVARHQSPWLPVERRLDAAQLRDLLELNAIAGNKVC